MRMRYLVAGACLIAGMVAVVQAQPGFFGGGRGGGGVSPTSLAFNKALQEELKLTEEQVGKIGEWAKDSFAKQGEAFKDSGIDFKDFKSPETQKKLAELNAKLKKEAYKELGDLLKKEQIERLKQIDRQAMGVNAFSDADVAAELKLTDSQKSSVKGITADYTKESRAIRDEAFKDKDKGGFGKGKGKGFAPLDPETQKKLTKLEKEAVGKIVDLLDDTQKKKWKELTGAEFDLAKLTPVFGKKKD